MMGTDTENIDDARYWAISGIGYGRGFTPGEAIENYVQAQVRNFPAKTTIYGTKARWEAALRTGDAKARVFHAPEGATGFVSDGLIHWIIPKDGKDTYVDATLAELLDDTIEREQEEAHG